MRRTWILASLAGFAAGASCILPAASVREGGTGGQTTTSATTTTTGTSTIRGADGRAITMPSDGLKVIAPTGTPMQRHLVQAGGTWWLFYLSPSGITLKKAPTFDDWQDITGGYPLQFAVGAFADGRMFGVDARENPSNHPLFHFGIVAHEVGGGVRKHGRGMAYPSGFLFDPPSTGDPSAVVADGTVSLLGAEAPFAVYDLGSGQTNQASALQYLPDPGGDGWDGGVPSSMALRTGSPKVSTRAGLLLDQTPVALWQDDTGLWSTVLMGSLAQPQQVAPLTSTDVALFAACAQPGDFQASPVVPPVVHALLWKGPSTPGTFVHQVLGPASSWQTPPHRALKARFTGDLFLACGKRKVYAFVIDTGIQEIQVAGWDPDAGWSDWERAVSAPKPVGARRCYLSGYDRIAQDHAETGVGLIWTEGAGCTTPPSTTAIYGAFVGVTDG